MVEDDPSIEGQGLLVPAGPTMGFGLEPERFGPKGVVSGTRSHGIGQTQRLRPALPAQGPQGPGALHEKAVPLPIFRTEQSGQRSSLDLIRPSSGRLHGSFQKGSGFGNPSFENASPGGEEQATGTEFGTASLPQGPKGVTGRTIRFAPFEFGHDEGEKVRCFLGGSRGRAEAPQTRPIPDETGGGFAASPTVEVPEEVSQTKALALAPLDRHGLDGSAGQPLPLGDGLPSAVALVEDDEISQPSRPPPVEKEAEFRAAISIEIQRLGAHDASTFGAEEQLLGTRDSTKVEAMSRRRGKDGLGSFDAQHLRRSGPQRQRQGDQSEKDREKVNPHESFLSKVHGFRRRSFERKRRLRRTTCGRG